MCGCAHLKAVIYVNNIVLPYCGKLIFPGSFSSRILSPTGYMVGLLGVTVSVVVSEVCIDFYCIARGQDGQYLCISDPSAVKYQV